MSSPMDPGALDQLREDLADQSPTNPSPVPHDLVIGLLSDRDHHAERAEHAISEAAGRLLDEGEPVGLRAKALDLAAKWMALGEVRGDKRCETYDHCGRGLRALAATDREPHPDSFRNRTIEAERERDLYREKLRELLGAGFDDWLNDADPIPF